MKRVTMFRIVRLKSTVAAAKQQVVNKRFAEIPGPPTLPVIGNLHLYKFGGIYKVDKYHKVLQQLHNQYGPLVKQQLGTETMIHVFDPDDVQTVYLAEGKWPHVSPLQETVQLYRKKRGLSLGLGNLNGKDWYRLRSATKQAMLRPTSVEQYLALVNKAALALVNRISKIVGPSGAEVKDLRDLVGKWSLESAGAVCFERELGCLAEGAGEDRAQKMVDANKLIFKLSAELKFSLPFYKYITTPKWSKLVKTEDLFYGLASEIVKETINEIKSQSGDETKKFSFLSHLLSQSELSSSDVDIITLSLFGDGLSTTTPFLMNCLRCLADNPVIQENVRAEVKNAVNEDQSLLPVVFKDQPYLKAFIKEAFRVYPNGTEISRILPQNTVLSGYNVPAGTHVNLNMGVNFNSTTYFKSPEMFRPERWIRGEGDRIHNYLLTPFGLGTRTCAGKRFAEQDLRVLLTQIVMNFTLESVAEAPLEHIYETLLFPVEPIGVKFVPLAATSLKIINKLNSQ